jgi:hypothetical protein
MTRPTATCPRCGRHSAVAYRCRFCPLCGHCWGAPKAGDRQRPRCSRRWSVTGTTPVCPWPRLRRTWAPWWPTPSRLSSRGRRWSRHCRWPSAMWGRTA